LIIPDEKTLSYLVAARLDLPISQRLLESKQFEYSTIKQCWENQLRFKRIKNDHHLFFLRYIFFYLDDDFISDCDLLNACTIYQKQIELIDKKKKKIIVPSKDPQTNGGQSSSSLSLGNSSQSYTSKKDLF
jgi:hypothetical protein